MSERLSEAMSAALSQWSARCFAKSLEIPFLMNLESLQTSLTLV